MTNKKNYHCCATCIHFRAERLTSGLRIYCGRLNYDTKPNHQFNCWQPKDRIRELMNRQTNP